MTNNYRIRIQFQIVQQSKDQIMEVPSQIRNQIGDQVESHVEHQIYIQVKFPIWFQLAHKLEIHYENYIQPKSSNLSNAKNSQS